MPTIEPTDQAAKPNKQFNPFRSIATLEEALDAQRAATGLAVLIALGYVILFGFQFLAPDRNPLGDSAPYTVINAVALVVALLMAVWVWTRRSLIATVVLAIWFLFERVSTAMIAPQTVNYMSIVIFLVGVSCAILAVRGHMAAGRIRKSPTPEPQVFD